MKIKKKWILRSIFSLKGNFSHGITPGRKIFDGVEVAPFWNASSAAVSISADLELNWAWRARAEEYRDERGITERHNLPYILDLLTDVSVPITWATVGHLFLSSCRRNGTHAHPDMPRPRVNDS